MSRLSGALTVVLMFEVVSCTRSATRRAADHVDSASEPTANAPTAKGGGPASLETCPSGGGPLSAPVAAAVERVLVDERRDEAHYATMARQFGDQSFRQPESASKKRSARLEALLIAHGRPVPNASTAPEPSYLSIGAGCADGVAIERALIDSYDTALGEALPDDVRCVLDRLRYTALQEHLPQWLTCAPVP